MTPEEFRLSMNDKDILKAVQQVAGTADADQDQRWESRETAAAPADRNKPAKTMCYGTGALPSGSAALSGNVS